MGRSKRGTPATSTRTNTRKKQARVREPEPTIPRRYDPGVGAATERSLELLDNEMPAEVLAWIFLYVRGPPASGALNESRLVCKRWREIIDAHLKCEKPREPYTSAFRLGYLSPPLLMQTVHMLNVSSELRNLARRAAEVHDGQLFRGIRDLIALHPLADTDSCGLHSLRATMLDHFDSSVIYHVQSGVWETLKLAELEFFVTAIHPLDVARAEQLGVSFTDQDLLEIFVEHSVNEANFVGWTDETLRRVLITSENFPEYDFERVFALPWLLPRDLVPENLISDCMRGALVRQIKYKNVRPGRPPIEALVAAIARNHWYDALNTDVILLAMEAELDILEMVVRGCSDATRRAAWLPFHGLDDEILEARGIELLEHALGIDDQVDPVTAIARLDLFYAHGMYRDATVAEANALVQCVCNRSSTDSVHGLPFEIDPENEGGDIPARVAGLRWLLTHVPLPDSPHIMGVLARSGPMYCDALLPLFLAPEYHLPWDPILIVSIKRFEHRDYWAHLELVQTLIDNGYCLPLVIGVPDGRPLLAYHCLIWQEVFRRLETRLAQRKCTFTEGFLTQARELKAGRDLLQRLDRMGVRYNDGEFENGH